MLNNWKKKIIVVLLASTVLASGFASAQSAAKAAEPDAIKLSLSDALKMAEENNPQVALSKLAVEKAELAQKEIKYQDKKAEEDEKKGSESQNPYALTPSDFEYKYQVDLGKKNAEVGLKMAQLGVDATLRNIRFGVEAAYYGALAAEDNLKISQDALSRQQELLKIAEAKLEAGVIAQRDLMDAQVQVSSAQAAAAKAESERQKAHISLKKLLNIDQGKKIALTETFDYKPAENVAEPDKLIQDAMQNRMDIIQKQGEVDIAQLDFDMTSKVYPSNTFQYKEKEYALNEAEMNLENKKKDVEAEVRGILLDLAQAQANIPVLDKTVETAKESLRLATLSFEAGMVVKVDVSQAEEALKQVELQRNQAIYNYNLAKIKLENVVYIPVSENTSGDGRAQ